MDTKQIDIILELSKTSNFNHAAENLYVSQPTVTYQINAVEKEIGFKIFERTGKGAIPTPAGVEFIASLRFIQKTIKRSIEQGQNFSKQFKSNVNIALPSRSSIWYLPQAMEVFSQGHPSVSVTPIFDGSHSMDSFLRGEHDIVFAMLEQVKRIPDITMHQLFKSRIYLVTKKEDPLAKKKLITTRDLKNRTLLIGGGSPRTLNVVQQRVLSATGIHYFNSPDHSTSLTYVAAQKGIVLAPGFLNDHTNEFAWTPFDCEETIPCYLCTHNGDQRMEVLELVSILKSFYQKEADLMV